MADPRKPAIVTPPKDLEPFARLKPGLTTDELKVDLNENAWHLIESASNSADKRQRVAGIGWWKGNNLKIHINLGFMKGIGVHKPDWIGVQNRYGKENVVRSVAYWTGAVHDQTITHANKKDPRLKHIKNRSGFSFFINVTDEGIFIEILNRSRINRRSFDIDPIADAYTALENYQAIGSIISAEFVDACYDKNVRNIPREYFKIYREKFFEALVKMQQASDSKEFNEDKKSHIKLKMKADHSCDWHNEKAWQKLCDEYKENPMAALEKIKKKIIKNLFIFLLNGSAVKKKAETETVIINGLVALNKKYGIQFDLDLNSLMIPADIKYMPGHKPQDAYPLALAVINNDMRMINCLTLLGAKIELLLDDPDILMKAIKTALKTKSIDGVKTIQFLFENGFKFNLSDSRAEEEKSPDSSISSVLKSAVINSHFDLMILLLQNGATLDSLKEESVLLDLIIENSDPSRSKETNKVVEYLLDHGIGASSESQFKIVDSSEAAFGYSDFILDNVVQSGNYDLMCLLISRGLDIMPLLKPSIIDMAIERAEKLNTIEAVKIVKHLLEKSAGLNLSDKTISLALNKTISSALRLAIISNDLDLLKVIINLNVDVIDDYKYNYDVWILALQKAVKTPDSDGEIIIQIYFERDVDHTAAFTLLAEHEDKLTPRMMNLILQNTDIAEYGATALDVAINKSNYLLAKKLFEKGAQCLHPENLLLLMCEYQDHEMVDKILKMSKDNVVHKINANGFSSTDIACERWNFEILKTLLAHEKLYCTYPLEDVGIRHAPNDKYISMLRFPEVNEGNLNELASSLKEFKLPPAPYQSILSSKKYSDPVKFMKIIDLLTDELKDMCYKMKTQKSQCAQSGARLFSRDVTAKQLDHVTKLYSLLNDIEHRYARIPFVSKLLPFISAHIKDFNSRDISSQRLG